MRFHENMWECDILLIIQLDFTDFNKLYETLGSGDIGFAIEAVNKNTFLLWKKTRSSLHEAGKTFANETHSLHDSVIVRCFLFAPKCMLPRPTYV